MLSFPWASASAELLRSFSANPPSDTASDPEPSTPVVSATVLASADAEREAGRSPKSPRRKKPRVRLLEAVNVKRETADGAPCEAVGVPAREHSRRASEPTPPVLAGASPARVTSDPVPLAGYIFRCNKETMCECIDRQMFGDTGCHQSLVESRVIAGVTKLFLFNTDSKLLYGVYLAVGPPGHLEPTAWNSGTRKFSAQVRVKELEKMCLRPADYSSILSCKSRRVSNDRVETTHPRPCLTPLRASDFPGDRKGHFHLELNQATTAKLLKSARKGSRKLPPRALSAASSPKTASSRLGSRPSSARSSSPPSPLGSLEAIIDATADVAGKTYDELMAEGAGDAYCSIPVAGPKAKAKLRPNANARANGRAKGKAPEAGLERPGEPARSAAPAREASRRLTPRHDGRTTNAYLASLHRLREPRQPRSPSRSSSRSGSRSSSASLGRRSEGTSSSSDEPRAPSPPTGPASRLLPPGPQRQHQQPPDVAGETVRAGRRVLSQGANRMLQAAFSAAAQCGQGRVQ